MNFLKTLKETFEYIPIYRNASQATCNKYIFGNYFINNQRTKNNDINCAFQIIPKHISIGTLLCFLILFKNCHLTRISSAIPS